jgi:hypothetical protein
MAMICFRLKKWKIAQVEKVQNLNKISLKGYNKQISWEPIRFGSKEYMQYYMTEPNKSYNSKSSLIGIQWSLKKTGLAKL